MKNIFKYNKETLSFEKLKTKTYINIIIYSVSILSLLFTLGWLSGTNKYIVNKWTHKVEVTDTLLMCKEKFSEKALVNLLVSCNVKFPHIVLAQAKLESGNYSSKMFKVNHNLFGMKKAKQRITTALGEKNGHAYYRDWTDGVYDYAMWSQVMAHDINNEVEYFVKLQKRYAEDTTYVVVLKSIIKSENLKEMFE